VLICIPEKADFAGVLSPAGLLTVEQRIHSFAEQTGCEICVATIKSSVPRLPSEYVFWLFNRWEIGGPAHMGIMLLLAVSEHRIESEVGCALEHIVTDEGSVQILRGHAVPFLSAGKFDDAVFHSVDVLARLVEMAFKLERRQ
jgi:uncharacterized membrane protein YgcG